MRLATITRPRFNQSAGRAFCSTKQTITTVPASGTNSFFLLDITTLPQWTALSGLYDLVRIRKVTMTFIPSWSVHDFAVGTASTLPMLHTVIDHEAVTAAAKTTAQLQEYSNYRFQLFDRPIVRSFVPAYSLSGSGSANNAASQPAYAQWMSTEALTSSNKGAGLYYNCDPLGGTPVITANFTVMIEVFLELKSMT